MKLFRLSDTDRKLVYKLEEELRELREGLGVTQKPRTWRGMVFHAMWFLVPFGVLWGLNVDPATAARASAVPFCAVFGLATVGWLFWTSSAEKLIKKVTVALEVVERMGQE